MQKNELKVRVYRKKTKWKCLKLRNIYIEHRNVILRRQKQTKKQ